MTVAQETDLALVQRARAGDASAFGTLYERHYARVQRVVSKYVKGDDAPDIVHDAFVKAIERLRNAQPDTDFRPWISQVAARCALDHVRSSPVKEERTAGTPSDDPGSSLLAIKLAQRADPNPDPEERALANERARLMTELLAPLRDWEREAVHLAAAGYELREIGRHQIRPATALKPALFRVRASLAQQIMDDPERYGPLDTERAARSLGNKLSAFVPRHRRPVEPAPLPEGGS